jgi:hypothetical protein
MALTFGRKVLVTYAIFEHKKGKQLIAKALPGEELVALNRDLSISRQRPRRVSDMRQLRDSNLRMEVERETRSDCTVYRTVRLWDIRRVAAKISDPDAPLEHRIDISPSALLTTGERQYVGISFGHPIGYFLAFVVPILSLVFWADHLLWVAVVALLAGFAVLARTASTGDKYKLHEILSAKERVRDAEQVQFRRDAREISWWKRLDGVQFETAVATLFAEWGYEVEATPYSGDGGVDLILRRSGLMGIVQCKAVGARIGVATVREFIGAKLQYPEIEETWIVSLCGFTKGARGLAAHHRIRLYSISQDFLGLRQA